MNDIIEETQEVNANDESNSPIIMMDEHDNNDIQQQTEKRPLHSRSRKRLMMPYEHSSKQPTQQPSKKRKRTYRRISKQNKQLFKYANSIIESIQHLNGRTVIHDLEDRIFTEEERKKPDQLLNSAFEAHFFKTHPPTINQVEEPSNQVLTDSNICSIPDESLFAILAGEEPLPCPINNEDAFQSIQSQLDSYIVDRLPKEFWGSKFYLTSSSQVDPPTYQSSSYMKYKKKDIRTIHRMTNIANSVDTSLLRFYNRRFSPSRTSRFLDTLCDRFSSFIDKDVLERARERMKYLSQDLFTKAPYQKRSFS